ncbi:MAG: hypothetical protein AB7R89_14860 [Dehalococcoidia bacterium]
MTTTRSPEGIIVEDVSGVLYDPITDRARVQGTGVEVFEVMLIYRSVGNDWDRLRAACDWLDEEQLRSALSFAEANPEYVGARLKKEEAAHTELERLWRDHPSTRPPRG